MEKTLEELKEILGQELELEKKIAGIKEKKLAILDRIGPKMKSDILSTEFCSITKDFKMTALSEKAVKYYCDMAPRVNKSKVRDAMDAGLDLSADIKMVPIYIVRKKRSGF